MSEIYLVVLSIGMILFGWLSMTIQRSFQKSKIVNRRFPMLFLNIYKYKEGKREEIIQQRVEKGTGAPEGTKMLGQWSRLDGSGGYMLYEQDKPDYAWTMMWNHLLDIEIVPVLDTEKDVMSLLK